MLGVRDVSGDPGTGAGVGPEVLRTTALVALDDRVGRGQDRLRGAVVLLQHDRGRVRIVLLELEDVADGRAAEGVDRLVRVTHDAQLGGGVLGTGRADQLPYERVLSVVGVLVLVDEDVPEAAAVVLGDVGERLEQVHRRHDDVVEVQGVRFAQPGLVERVSLGERLLEAVGGLSGEGLLVDQLVLQVRHLRRERLRREALRVEVEIAADEGHEALGVGRVVDRERGGEAEPLRLAAQDPYARAVEGHDPHGVGPRSDELLDALLHLAGGLVGEGDRQDLARVDPALGQQVGDAVGQHAGLARTGTGNDEQRGAGVHDGCALLGVQPVEQRGGVDDRAVGPVAVVRVTGRRGPVENAREEALRHRFGCGVLGGRRGPFLRVLEAGQETVVKEAAHRLPSLGVRTDTPRPSDEPRIGSGHAERAGDRTAWGDHGPHLPRSTPPRRGHENVSGISNINLHSDTMSWLACSFGRPVPPEAIHAERASTPNPGCRTRSPEPGTHTQHRGESVRNPHQDRRAAFRSARTRQLTR